MQKDSFDIHTKDFFIFRKATNEVRVIVEQISKIISQKYINNFLDIGAGSGELTKAVVKKFKIKNTIAIDRKDFNKKKFKNICFLKKDWLKFIYPKKFDFILSAHSMAYLSFQEADKSIEKIYNYLGKNGVAIIIVYDKVGNWSKFKKIFYPRQKICTLDYIKPIISRYKFEEKTFLTEVFASNLEHMLTAGRFLAEKYLQSYLNKRDEIEKFFKKFQLNNKRIVFPLQHKLFILYK